MVNRYLDSIHVDWSDLSFPEDPLRTKDMTENMKSLREAINVILEIAKKNQLLHIPEIIYFDDETHKDHGISDLPQCY